MDYLVTFLEGVVTFVSPCLLPMLPIYLAYFAGDAVGEGHDSRRTLVGALGFVAGFALVFCALGAFAGTLGRLLLAHQRVLDVACGAVVIVLGLNYLGVIHLSLLDRVVGPQGYEASAAPDVGLVAPACWAWSSSAWSSPLVGPPAWAPSWPRP